MFQCECCGSQHHADSKASQSIKKRFLDGSYLNLHSKGQCLSFLRSQFVLQLESRIRHGIVDPKQLAFLLSQGVNGKRGFIAEPVGLALLTDALKRVTSFQ